MIPGAASEMQTDAHAGDHGRCRARDPDARRADHTGNFFLDDEVLAAAGVTDLSRYAVQPGNPLLPDLFLD